MKKPESDEDIWKKKELIAACGLYCGACPVYIANAGLADLDVVAAERHLPREEVVCEGCQGSQVTAWCRTCVMRTCTQGRHPAWGVDQTCTSCPDFPCADYQAFRDDPAFPYHQDAPGNLETLRRKGAVAWIDLQDSSFRCPTCRRRLSWWDRTCPDCSRPVLPITPPGKV